MNVQAMVYGNMGETSATGVAFTRDSATGEDIFNGEYLVNAQGEDVVAGVRTPSRSRPRGAPLVSCRVYRKRNGLRSTRRSKR